LDPLAFSVCAKKKKKGRAGGQADGAAPALSHHSNATRLRVYTFDCWRLLYPHCPSPVLAFCSLDRSDYSIPSPSSAVYSCLCQRLCGSLSLVAVLVCLFRLLRLRVVARCTCWLVGVQACGVWRCISRVYFFLFFVVRYAVYGSFWWFVVCWFNWWVLVWLNTTWAGCCVRIPSYRWRVPAAYSALLHHCHPSASHLL